MYKVATFLVDHFWGQSANMADALGVLLLTWNNALYRYGLFDFEALENALTENLPVLKALRTRDILSYSTDDKDTIRRLFRSFLSALQIAGGRSQGVRSPVAVAKALHLLAPAFFPLWDDKIAKAYRCRYSRDPEEAYLRFVEISREMASNLNGKVALRGMVLLKVIDEYNYAKFTKEWT